jgi:hypothetical protein
MITDSLATWQAGTAAMEAITAVLEGPLCWLIAYGAVHQSAWRHPAQLVLCSAQVSTCLNRRLICLYSSPMSL